MSPPRILDPTVVPVTATDAHLPAVAATALVADALRLRLAQAAAWPPELAGDGAPHSADTHPRTRAPAAAAVLVALVQRPHGLQVLLTRRTDHLRDHAGQISFPGGRTETFDADATATALREAHEEVGLAPTRVEVLGRLPAYTTISSFVVTPVVALVMTPFDLNELALDSFEVAEAFEVPLAHLMNPRHHQRHSFSYDGGERQFLSMPWAGPGADGVQRNYFIWGATAAMLRNLYSVLIR
jgi:8-oxo-dGTP pyrophosphatase MutT (NUDIX family)